MLAELLVLEEKRKEDFLAELPRERLKKAERKATDPSSSTAVM
jgi:hypothetical protein